MYDITRNIILGQGVNIPYQEIYWTANVFVDGRDKPSTAYMFSTDQRDGSLDPLTTSADGPRSTKKAFH